LTVVEDGAQGFGGSIGDRKACTFGKISAISFFPAKPLGCYGDGGAVFTNDDEMAERLKSIRVHGKGSDKYSNMRIGINGRLDTIQAAVLLEKLKIFDHELAIKNQTAEEYNAMLERYVDVPIVKDEFTSSWAQYTIKVRDERQREFLIKAFSDKQIPTAVYYKHPLHTLELYSGLEYLKHMDYSVSERLAEQVLSLPMHAYLTEEEIRSVSDVIAM
jgi:dTDP-4-amino-4,6-dideoxygalactose transaminase